MMFKIQILVRRIMIKIMTYSIEVIRELIEGIIKEEMVTCIRDQVLVEEVQVTKVQMTMMFTYP